MNPHPSNTATSGAAFISYDVKEIKTYKDGPARPRSSAGLRRTRVSALRRYRIEGDPSLFVIPSLTALCAVKRRHFGVTLKVSYRMLG
jgi:hypothetical protein